MKTPQAATTSRDIAHRLAATAPRVQCLTNTVAQSITANCLLALGGRVSMATHPDEVVAMTASAQGVLINLGTMDPVREAAIKRLVESGVLAGKPVVLDPVFCELSPLRLDLAKALLDEARIGRLIVRGNASEIAALREGGVARVGITWATTGPIDRIEQGTAHRSVAHGHPLMAQVTGMGCAAGAVVAAFASIEADPVGATEAALTIFGQAGERAASLARGPGTFASAFIDELALARRQT